LENPIPHINVPAEFNQNTSESAHGRRNRLLKVRRARQRTKSIGPFETPQEQSNCLCQEQRIVQQAITCAQPSFNNDALQLFGDEDVLASTRWDYGEMDIICGFYNAKMWIKK
jgi:hypothetical protein